MLAVVGCVLVVFTENVLLNLYHASLGHAGCVGVSRTLPVIVSMPVLMMVIMVVMMRVLMIMMVVMFPANGGMGVR
jgi:hypothetical protein